MRASLSRRLAAVAIAAVGLACPRRVPPPRVAPQAVSQRSALVTAPSGLRIALYEEPWLSTFRLTASYRAGAVDEPAGKEGLAHLTAHATFASQPSDGVATLRERLLAAGFQFGVQVGLDTTAFWMRGRPDQLALGLRLEAHRMVEPLQDVDEGAFGAEKARVLEEVRETERDARGATLRALLEAAFPKHPYGRHPWGRSAPAAGLDLSDARAFAGARYRPEAAVLVLAGPLSLDEMKRIVSSALAEGLGAGRDEAPAPRRPPAMPRDPDDPALVAITGAVEVPQVVVAWRVPGFFAGEEQLAREIAATIDDTLREREARRSAAPSAHAAQLAGRHAAGVGDRARAEAVVLDGAALIVVTAAVEQGDEVGRVLDELRGLPDGMLVWNRPDDVLERMAAVKERLDQSEMANVVRATGSPDWVERMEAVTGTPTAERLHWVRRWLRAEWSVAIVVQPDARLAARALRLVAPAAPAREELGVRADAPATAPLGRIALLHRAAVPHPTPLVLANGVRVLAVRRAAAPWLEARLVFPRPPDPAGPSSAALGPADEAVSPRAGEDLLEYRERLPAGALAQALDELVGRVKAASAEESFGDEAARRWLAGALHPDRATLVVVGDVPDPVPRDLLDLHFGHWGEPSPAQPAGRPAPAAPPARTVSLLDAPGAEEAQVRVALPVSGADGGARAAADALAWHLGRRMAAALPQHGVLSPVSAAMDPRATGGALVIEATVPIEQVPDAVRTIIDAIAETRDAPPREQAARRALWEAARSLLGRFDTAAETSDALVLAAECGSAELWEDYRAALAAMPITVLADAARRLEVGREAIVIRGDRARLLPLLAGAGLAPTSP